MGRLLKIVAIALVAAVVLVVAVGYLITRSPDAAARIGELTGEARPDPNAAGVTMANYNRLATGMSYRDAVKLLGSRGVEISSSELAGIRTVMYQWEAGSGANMNAMFQNDRLVSKAQLGLR